MRDYQLQTPLRDQASANRRSKSTPDVGQNLRKITKKSLNPVFKAVSEDNSVVFECSKEISEVSDENPFTASPENFITTVNPVYPVDTPSSEASAISDLTSPSLPVTSNKYPVINASDTKYEHPKLDPLKKIGSIEAEMVIKHLKEARIHIRKSNDIGPSKKLLDALINGILEEFNGCLYEEKEWLDKLLSSKANLVILSFMLAFAVFIFWYSNLGAEGFETGLKPT